MHFNETYRRESEYRAWYITSLRANSSSFASVIQCNKCILFFFLSLAYTATNTNIFPFDRYFLLIFPFSIDIYAIRTTNSSFNAHSSNIFTHLRTHSIVSHTYKRYYFILSYLTLWNISWWKNKRATFSFPFIGSLFGREN